MIYHNGKQISAIYYGSKTVVAVYYGAKVVWQMVSSCFGTGHWINLKPWRNQDAWKNK